MLKGYKIHKTYDELLDFYSKNVHEIELKHVPSRDPDKFVPLYTASGTKRNFTFSRKEFFVTNLTIIDHFRDVPSLS